MDNDDEVDTRGPGRCACLTVSLVALVSIANVGIYIALWVNVWHIASLCAVVLALMIGWGVLVGGMAVYTVLWTRERVRKPSPLQDRGLLEPELEPDEVEVIARRSLAWRCRAALSPRCCCKGLLLALCAVGVVAMWAFFVTLMYVLLTTQPSLHGELRFAGLDAPVVVVRENGGVVHIKATTAHDAYFAQGVAHAQNRLWQMEFQRLVGQGRLSSVVGSGALDIDKEMRTLGVYRASQRLVASNALSHNATQALQAYCDGVNAYLDSSPPLPFEFFLLGHSPEPWRLEDSIVWSKLMSLDLSGNMYQELDRWRFLTKLGLSEDRVAQLMPPFDPSVFPTVLQRDSIQGGGVNASAHGSGVDAAFLDQYTRDWLAGAWDRQQRKANGPRQPKGAQEQQAGGSGGWWQWLTDMASCSSVPRRLVRPRHNAKGRGWTLGASNNWVVHGNLTQSGKPLLSNDPHLMLMAPSIWILNSVAFGNHTAIGASFAGVPGVVIGHNGHIAWGVTNTGADVQDLYMMQDNPTNSSEYLFRGRYVPYALREEEIKVKGGDATKIVVRESVYGAVINENGVNEDYEGEPLCLRWVSTLASVDDTTLDAFLEINMARNFDEFRQALRSYVAPAQNFIYADVEGNIGYQMPGKVPLRAANHSGGWPVPGDGSYDAWELGFVPFDSLPRTFNPSEGFVASANNKVTPSNYKYLLTVDWDSGSEGYRAKRITEMVLASTDHTVDTMAEIQSDYYSLLAHQLIPFARALDTRHIATERGLEVRDMLLKWDRVMSTGDTEPSLFAAWFAKLATLGAAETASDFWSNPIFIANALSTTAESPDPACVERFESCQHFLGWTFDEVGSQHVLGKDWGLDTHKAHFEHQILHETPLSCLADRQTTHGGDDSTVNVGTLELDTFAQRAGPSYRHVIDLAALHHSRFINPMGNSGDLLSRQYDNWLEDWSAGVYLEMRARHVGGTKQTLKPKDEL